MLPLSTLESQLQHTGEVRTTGEQNIRGLHGGLIGVGWLIHAPNPYISHLCRSEELVLLVLETTLLPFLSERTQNVIKLVLRWLTNPPLHLPAGVGHPSNHCTRRVPVTNGRQVRPFHTPSGTTDQRPIQQKQLDVTYRHARSHRSARVTVDL
jgi:hypothetical protein